MEGEELRKGHWTEEEDMLLVNCVGVLGDRRWDFIAKESGLRRTGKSCRLRWMNYLHPSLKHGDLSPEEQHLIIQLHARLGNRWSRIAKNLPGRTDNEIKNFWRTHTRKKLHHENNKRNAASARSSSALTTVSPSCSSSFTCSSLGEMETSRAEPQDRLVSNNNSTGDGNGGGDCGNVTMDEKVEEDWKNVNYYPMEKLWEDIAMSDVRNSSNHEESFHESYLPQPISPLWDFYWNLTEIDDEIWQGP